MKAPTKKVVKQAKKDIEEIDESLSLLRDNWLVCSEKNKVKYQKLIDRMLDERLICMAARDGKVPTPDV
jgi:hypothetical protein